MHRTLFLVCVLSTGLLLGCATTGTTPERGSLEAIAEWRIGADKAYADGNYKKALELYQNISRTVPADAEIHFRIGNTYNRMGDVEKAFLAYKETLVRDQSYSKAWYNAGLVQLKMAAQTFHEATAYLQPGDPVHAASLYASEQLLKIVEQSNESVLGPLYANQNKSLNVDNVEVIILDKDKSGLSDTGSNTINNIETDGYSLSTHLSGDAPAENVDNTPKSKAAIKQTPPDNQ